MRRVTWHRLCTAETPLPVCKSTEFHIRYPFGSEGLKPLVVATLLRLHEDTVGALLYSIVLGQILSTLNHGYSEKGSLKLFKNRVFIVSFCK